MFTLPPRPPVDYVLKTVNQNATSAEAFTPDDLPRVTQPTVGQYCFPIYANAEKPSKSKPKIINPLILDKWAKDARASWVDRPEENAPFLNEIFKKYTVVTDCETRSTRKPISKIMTRSCKYELECIEANRLELLKAKCELEALEEGKAQMQHAKLGEAQVKKFEPMPCKWQPPTWWRTEENVFNDWAGDEKEMPVPKTNIKKHKRWQQEPDYTKLAVLDPLQRRLEMSRVGQTFKNEAINWYLVHYPSAKLKFVPRKCAS